MPILTEGEWIRIEQVTTRDLKPGMGAQILAELGLKKIRLLSNTRRKIVALEGYGLEIVENVSLEDMGKKSNDLAELGRVRKFP